MKSRLILAGATLALTGAVAVAQNTAKPSPYEGTSEPPASDVIRATDSPAVAPAAPPPALPAPAPVTVKQAPAATQNPDDGIVTVPVTAETGAPAQTPGLQSRQSQTRQPRLYNPDADIVSSVTAPDNALAEGTAIHTRLDHELSSSENGVGTPFTA